MSAISLKSGEKDDEVTDVSADIDAKRWPTLSQYVNSVLTEQYHGLSTRLLRYIKISINIGFFQISPLRKKHMKITCVSHVIPMCSHVIFMCSHVIHM